MILNAEQCGVGPSRIPGSPRELCSAPSTLCWARFRFSTRVASCSIYCAVRSFCAPGSLCCRLELDIEARTRIDIEARTLAVRACCLVPTCGSVCSTAVHSTLRRGVTLGATDTVGGWLCVGVLCPPRPSVRLVLCRTRSGPDTCRLEPGGEDIEACTGARLCTGARRSI